MSEVPYVLHLGDCLDVMKAMPENSVDAVVTDPPYHLLSIVERFGGDGAADAQWGTDGAFSRFTRGFMGKTWDGGDIAFRAETWREVLRVLKPGGHLLAFNHSRTWHRMTCAIEDAGFEVRDTILWLYGSAMPKSHSMALNFEKTLAKQVGDPPAWVYADDGEPMATKPPFRHPMANEWWEWGTALKPAFEPIVMARKPIAGRNLIDNIIQWLCGALNIGRSRIPVDPEADASQLRTMNRNVLEREDGWGMSTVTGGEVQVVSPEGRWPANVIHDGSDEVLEAFSEYGERRAGSPVRGTEPSGLTKNVYNPYASRAAFDPFKDKGTAARFFFSAKTTRRDRNEGCEHLDKKPLNWSSGDQSPGTFQSDGTDKSSPNHHPTVKPTALMAYLIGLVTPKGGVVLDPFMGSGSTGKAAMIEGYSFIGIEREEEYMPIAVARIAHGIKIREEATRQLDLFAAE